MIINVTIPEGPVWWVEFIPFLGPLSVALITAVTAFYLYRFQKKVDRTETIISEKRLAYRCCLSSFTTWATNLDDDSSKKDATGKFGLVLVYGNPSVSGEVEKSYNNLKDNSGDFTTDLIGLARVMRDDINEEPPIENIGWLRRSGTNIVTNIPSIFVSVVIAVAIVQLLKSLGLAQ